jgi:hypothetical protein
MKRSSVSSELGAFKSVPGSERFPKGSLGWTTSFPTSQNRAVLPEYGGPISLGARGPNDHERGNRVPLSRYNASLNQNQSDTQVSLNSVWPCGQWAMGMACVGSEHH